MLAHAIHSRKGAVFQNTESDVGARASQKLGVFGILVSAITMPLDTVGHDIGAAETQELHRLKKCTISGKLADSTCTLLR